MNFEYKHFRNLGMKLKSLTVILFSLTSSLVVANESTSKYEPKSIADNAFFKDTKIVLSTKNYWKYLKEEAENPKTVHNAWGHGVAVSYQSGYLADFISLNADFYRAFRLAASDHFASRGVLYNKGNKAKSSNAGGYTKIGQRYVKLKAKVADVNLNGNIGWHTMKNFGVISNTTRLSPTTYQGYSATLNYGEVTLKGAYITHSISRDSPDKKQFKSRDGKHTIDYIATGDISLKNKFYSAEYAIGESKDYLRRQIFLGSIKPIDKLTIGTQLYFTKSLNNYKKMALSKRYFDKHANHYAADVKWQDDKWGAKIGIAYTDAKKGQGQLGYYHRHMSSHSRGTFMSMTQAGEDYLRHGERALSTIIDYKLYPDLTLGLTANYGEFKFRHTTVRSSEFNLFTSWIPTNNSLKGLTLWGMVGPGWSYKHKNRTPILRNGKSQTAPFLGAEFIAEYRFNLL